jgi:hypothetical protein
MLADKTTIKVNAKYAIPLSRNTDSSPSTTIDDSLLIIH